MNPIIPDDILTGTVVAEKGDRRVEIEWIGEGKCGDFDETDHDDIPLLRFTVLDRGDDWASWETVSDGSYCTNLPATLPRKIVQAAAEYLLRQVEGVPNIKKLCEQLSWIDEKQARELAEKK